VTTTDYQAMNIMVILLWRDFNPSFFWIAKALLN